MSDIGLVAGEGIVDKVHENLCPHAVYILVGERLETKWLKYIISEDSKLSEGKEARKEVRSTGRTGLVGKYSGQRRPLCRDNI